MLPAPPQIDPEQARHWLRVIFDAKAAQTGGVVRRSIKWVDHEVGRDRLIEEVRRRDFRMLECGGQFVIICAPGSVRMVV